MSVTSYDQFCEGHEIPHDPDCDCIVMPGSVMPCSTWEYHVTGECPENDE